VTPIRKRIGVTEPDGDLAALGDDGTRTFAARRYTSASNRLMSSTISETAPL